MNIALARTRDRLFHYRHPSAPGNVAREVLQDLRREPKRIHPKFFYDSTGALLFERITELAEYYPTRSEREILRRHAPVIAACVGSGRVLIEPGSGASNKVELLLDALRPSAYVAIDIAATQLEEAAMRLASRFPWLEIHAVAADYSATFALPPALSSGSRLLFYPGSTIGNFEPAEARQFLRRRHKLAGPGGGLLIGVDLEKDIERLEQAYNDSKGVTAAFNLNVLRHLNRVAGADFRLENFRHLAFYNRDLRRIEMHLVSLCRQTVTIGDSELTLASGERIHTENSHKYTTESFAELAASAGFALHQSWYDREKLFSVHYLLAH